MPNTSPCLLVARYVLLLIVKSASKVGAYALHKLQWEEVILQNLGDEKLYTCGSPLFPSNSLVVDTIVVQQNINCSTPMECQYYSSK